ncbi:hypothetical protein Nepgr_026461 [Nepenthes gracilis]|uniref:Uncharacterized protein n=1 Tax=Nepenthes gracilis TaxID=150966 RepID=A0AAD3T722_NEPGR|nr:hypothetical protein Nepgr_026461 [Nepenthes gracilis]
MVDAVSVPDAGGPIGLVDKLAQVREEVLIVEAILTKERVPDLSIELARVLKKPIVCPADMGKDVEATRIVEASWSMTPVSESVTSSFHPSPRVNRLERDSIPASDPVASSSHQSPRNHRPDQASTPTSTSRVHMNIAT